jgi:tetratricopeptide (TPR) repeat protein
MGKHKQHQKQGKSFVKDDIYKQWYFLITMALAALIYSNTLQHGYVLDDISVISENRFVTQGTAGLKDIWTNSYRAGYWNDSGTLYRPLVQSIFAIQWQLFPNNPSAGHFFNILCYAILCGMMYLLIKSLTENKNWAFMSALLFTACTVHTEVVANIKSLDEILAMLLSLIAWHQLVIHQDKPKPMHLILAIASFTAAMFTKEGAIAMVAVIPVSLYFFKHASLKSLLQPFLVLLVPAIVYLLARASVLGGITASIQPSSIDNPLVDYTMAERWLTGFKLLAMYLQKLMLPHPLAYEYAFNSITPGSMSDAYTWFGVALAGLLVYAIFKGFKSRAWWAFAAFYFGATMLLYTNTVVIIGAMFAERFLFFASFAFAVALAWLILQMKYGLLRNALFALIVLTYSTLSYARNKVWESSYSLYAADVDVLQSSCKAHYNYGLETMKVKAMKAQNQVERTKYLNQAIQSFEQALEIKPGYNLAKGQIALAHYRLGNYQESIRRYVDVLAKNPNDDAGWNNLAGAYVATKQYESALGSYKKAIALNPYYVDALGNAGAVHGMLGQHKEAIGYLERAAALAPGNGSYQQYLAMSYQALGNAAQAQIHLNRAKQLGK